ncbi:FAD-dependent oxidoreductase [Arthrobacter oryzae]|uniref:FAD-dependent oxidoreductase n=1 Tax=Arthrobacter oryzae TaxID=409290 RepID=UPI00285E5BE8|nr:FAD-dependent oxidoreductase [Arthrobacter oryzae]MDR6506249.1 glycine/D-amino acid oxidase-like deaminating enzyme/nitrite reductase/ring-hydroxylating ferredoxin subunit [Arthrobacter oryzae]
MTSLWLDRTHTFRSDQFHPRGTYDTVVAGAGLTGLVTALLLARSGKKVLVVEARSPGAVTTGNTTAKVSLLQGTVLSALRNQYPQKVVDAYVEMNREGQAWLLRYLESRGVAFQRRDAYTYATSEDGAEVLRKELAAARAAGLTVEYLREPGLPFAVKGALRLGQQAQIHPMEVIDALVDDVRSHGGQIVSGVRLNGLQRFGGLRGLDGRRAEVEVQTDHGPVHARDVVLATGTPVLDRGLYFAKLKPLRSYAAAFELPGTTAVPDGMFLSVEQPVRSLRDFPADGRRLLLVGGNGHPVGRARSAQAYLDTLIDWTTAKFPGASLTHSWSAQDYQATNLMPFFGKLPRGLGRVYFATGYNKWGMTNSVAAALDITADILGTRLPWANVIHHRVTSPSGAASAATLNAAVAATLARDWAQVGLKRMDESREQPPEGAGLVTRRGRKPVAVSTVDGTRCELSAVCTHLGGIVRWNDSEKSWDCPLHGSRFSSNGTVLEGPATRDLRQID